MKKLFPALILVAAAILGWQHFDRTDGERPRNSSPGARQPSVAQDRGELPDRLEGSGVVIRVLGDDNKGSRHQRFILRLDSGRTVLVAHNIDVAPRIPGIGQGDTVEFSGEFESNPQGGVLHWTHHDPVGRHRGGWLRHEGRTYE